MPAPAPEPSRRPGGVPPRLSAREREILASIEDSLLDDPDLGIAARRRPRRWTFPLRSALLLVLVLGGLVLAASLLPAALWWLVLPPLTLLSAGAWVIDTARRTRR